MSALDDESITDGTLNVDTAPVVEAAARDASVAMSRLEEALTGRFGSVPDMNSAVREELVSALRSEARNPGLTTSG